jgi:hypothetical protein
MTAHTSTTDLLVLHAVRLKGFADTDIIAARFALDPHQTQEDLLDAEAHGWVTRSCFADQAGWSLTEAGRRRNETQLQEELDRTRTRDAVRQVHHGFPALNARATQLFTSWQLADGIPAADARALDQLTELAAGLHGIERDLTAHLARFGGYHDRLTRSVANARSDRAWVTGMGLDSCHRVWFELHEDLIATLGMTR